MMVYRACTDSSICGYAIIHHAVRLPTTHAGSRCHAAGHVTGDVTRQRN